MGFGEKIIKLIETRRRRFENRLIGPLGDFYRNGGNRLLYDLPISTGDLVIDLGGYEGDWTKKVICRYGCRSEIYEPIPEYFEKLKDSFSNNAMVNLHDCAVGNENRFAKYSLMEDGTSEFVSALSFIEVPVKDILEILIDLNEPIACLKMNIESGEYDVLERIIDEKKLNLFGCLLIQFHNQPKGWETRLEKIKFELQKSFNLEFSYHLVWEKWVAKKPINKTNKYNGSL